MILLSFELNYLWSKKICRPKMIVWSGTTFILGSLDDLVYIFLDTSNTLAMFLCHRTLILLNNLKTGELDLEGLWRRRRRRLVVLPQEAVCGFPSWRKPGREILLKLLVHPLQGEDGEHGVVGPESSIMVCKVDDVIIRQWCHRGAGHDGSSEKQKKATTDKPKDRICKMHICNDLVLLSSCQQCWSHRNVLRRQAVRQVLISLNIKNRNWKDDQMDIFNKMILKIMV